jgi:hypothetical protein
MHRLGRRRLGCERRRSRRGDRHPWLSPHRVLRECYAKRQTIEVLTRAEAQSDAWHRGQAALQRMVLPYADHPDYRDEWRP